MKYLYNKSNALIEVATKVGLTLNLENSESISGAAWLRAYKGVSFNPFGAGQRESLLLLDFLSFLYEARNIIDEPIILDASPYWILNQLDFQFTNPSALLTAESLVEQAAYAAWENSDFEDIRRTASLRYRYLQAISGDWARICTALDIWTAEGFTEILAAAIEQFCKYQNGKWQVTDAAEYYRYDKYSNWFTPLVAAEQLFMLRKVGCQAFVAPVEEAGWSEKSKQFIGNSGNDDFCRLLYKRPSGIFYNYDFIPSFADDKETLMAKVQKGKKGRLETLIFKLAAPFVNKQFQEMGADVVMEFIREINSKVAEMEPVAFPKTDMRLLKWSKNERFYPRYCYPGH